MKAIFALFIAMFFLVSCGQEATTKKNNNQAATDPNAMYSTVTDPTATVNDPTVIDPTVTTTTTTPTSTVGAITGVESIPNFASLPPDVQNYLKSWFAAASATPTTVTNPSTPVGSYSFSYSCLNGTCTVVQNGVTSTMTEAELRAKFNIK